MVLETILPIDSHRRKKVCDRSYLEKMLNIGRASPRGFNENDSRHSTRSRAFQGIQVADTHLVADEEMLSHDSRCNTRRN